MNNEASRPNKGRGPRDDFERESYGDPTLTELRRARAALDKALLTEKISEAKYLELEAGLQGEINAQTGFLGITPDFTRAAALSYEHAELTVAQRRAQHSFDIHTQRTQLRTPEELTDETFQGITQIVELDLAEATAILASYEMLNGLVPLPDSRTGTDNPQG